MVWQDCRLRRGNGDAVCLPGLSPLSPVMCPGCPLVALPGSAGFLSQPTYLATSSLREPGPQVHPSVSIWPAVYSSLTPPPHNAENRNWPGDSPPTRKNFSPFLFRSGYLHNSLLQEAQNLSCVITFTHFDSFSCLTNIYQAPASCQVGTECIAVSKPEVPTSWSSPSTHFSLIPNS